MKLSLYITLSAIIGIATMQAASAQQAPGARFNFAPNTWKAESGNVPKGYGEPAHNVQSGSVPTNDILGVDPVMLSKPAPLPVVTTRLTPQLMAPKTNANANFNPAFGRPTLAQLPSTAPVVPQHATAMPMARVNPAAAQPAQAAKPMVQTKVAAVLKPRHTTVQPRKAAPVIASYPTNFGYVPGQMLAHNTASGHRTTTTSVNGVLLH
jgi:hypothetical protein